MIASLTLRDGGRLDGRSILGQTDYEDAGTWRIDGDGRICMTWNNQKFATNGCFSVIGKAKEIRLRNAQGQTIYVVPI